MDPADVRPVTAIQPRPAPADAPVSDETGACDQALVERFLTAEHRFQDLLDECVAARPALGRSRLTAMTDFLDDAAWRGVDALEALQARPAQAVHAAVQAAVRAVNPPVRGASA
jgi:hypothetical protein